MRSMSHHSVRHERSRRIQRAMVPALFLVVAVITLWTKPAQAYPQWQFSSGSVRCNQCHYAPAGGGLITSFGRDAAGEELSMLPGNGAFLHGAVALPSWLALGGDVRGAVLAHDAGDPNGATTAAFPMQADLTGRVAFGRGFSFYGVAGLRGRARRSEELVPTQNYQPISTSRLISREHWVMWQPEVIGPYVRAGRFYAPFGLRMAEHILYARRDLGFNLLEESYNISGGFVREKTELHVTAFAPDFLRNMGSREKGVSIYYERRLFGDRAAIAGQGRVASGPGMTRFMLGVVGKGYIEPLKTLLLAELNGVEQTFDDNALDTRDQLLATGGFAVLPVRGMMVTMLAERFQVDLQTRNAGYTAATALVNWFPYPHIELQVMGRLQFPSGGYTTKTVLAQLHYYL